MASTVSLEPLSAGEKTATAHRPQPVCLEVPVLLEAVGDATADRKAPLHEETWTVLVFPRGAVVRTSNVEPGQQVIAVNKWTNRRVRCLVVHSKTYHKVKGYAEIEFTEPAAGFWGVHFPEESIAGAAPAPAPAASSPAGDTSARPVALKPQPQPIAADVRPPKPVKPMVAEYPSVPPVPMAPRRTEPLPLAEPIERQTEPLPPPPPEIVAPVAPVAPASQPAPLSRPTPLAVTPVADPLPQLASDTSVESSVPAVQFDGSHFVAPARKSRKGWVWAVAAVLVLGLGGAGVWLYQSGWQVAAFDPAPKPASTSPDSAVSAAGTSAQATDAPPAEQSNPTSDPSAPASVEVPATPPQAGAQTVLGQPADTQKAAVKIAPRMLAPAPLAAPVRVKQTTGAAQESAPQLSGLVPAGVSPSQELPVSELPEPKPLAPPEPTAPAPAPTPAPVQVGGKLERPRLVSAVPPLYPRMARQSRVEGDVVVEATINEKGQVTGTQVVSGPALLHQAARDAVSKWKYQPATLNGQPITLQLLVTVRFRL